MMLLQKISIHTTKKGLEFLRWWGGAGEGEGCGGGGV